MWSRDTPFGAQLLHMLHINFRFVKMAELKIGFVGAGSMAQGIIDGWLRANTVTPSQLMASAPTNKNLTKLKAMCIATTNDNAELVRSCDIVVISCKPYQCKDVLPPLPFTPNHLVLSVVAGLSVEIHEQFLTPGTRFIRTMPNVAVSVCAGHISVVRGTHATDEDMTTVANLMKDISEFVVTTDKFLEILSSTSGTGVAWMAMIMEGLADGAVNMGLPREMAMQAAAIALVGTGKMYLESRKHPGVIKDSVTSPGGTTIRGVHALEKSGVRSAMMNAVEAAYTHNKSLSKN